MRQRGRAAFVGRTISLAVVSLLGLYFLFSVLAFAGAMWEQRKAEKMLSAVRQMHLGMTTQTEFLNKMSPFYESVPDRDGVHEVIVNYSVINFSHWTWTMCQHVPGRIGRVLHRCGSLLVVIFSVKPSFVDGKLARLDVEEMTEGLDGVHPIMAAVHDHVQGTGKYEGIEEGSDFSGYSSGVRQEENEDGAGHAVGLPWGLRTDVEMDDRASVKDRESAYRFHLECFTRLAGCQDSRLLLKPAPDPVER